MTELTVLPGVGGALAWAKVITEPDLSKLIPSPVGGIRGIIISFYLKGPIVASISYQQVLLIFENKITA